MSKTTLEKYVEEEASLSIKRITWDLVLKLREIVPQRRASLYEGLAFRVKIFYSSGTYELGLEIDTNDHQTSIALPKIRAAFEQEILEKIIREFNNKSFSE